MVHLNELHEKYAEKGLVVLGLTNEARGTVDAFCEEFGPKYPIVIESGDSMRGFRAGSFPTIVLIGPDGRIASTANPSDQAIEAALENVRLRPEMPKSLSAVTKAMRKDQYAKALGKLSKAKEEDAAVAKEMTEWILWFGQSSLDGAIKDQDAGNVYMAWQSLDYLGDAFKGHEIGSNAADAAKAIMKDKALKNEVKAGKLLDELRAEMADAATAKSALKCLKPILTKKYADTKAGKEARKLADELEAAANK